MIHPLIPVTLLALAAPAAAAMGDGEGGVLLAQLTVHERIIIRVPRMQPSVSRSPTPPAERWKEKKGPKCVAASALAGAMISQPGSVDLILAGGQRLRAKIDEDCGPLDYYSGFYLRPATDGEICANRDVIRVRSGGSCEIEGFKKLVAAH